MKTALRTGKKYLCNEVEQGDGMLGYFGGECKNIGEGNPCHLFYINAIVVGFCHEFH